MASDAHTIALKADPNDPEDGDVTVEAVEQALAERAERLRVRGLQVAPVQRQVRLRLDPDAHQRSVAGGQGLTARLLPHSGAFATATIAGRSRRSFIM